MVKLQNKDRIYLMHVQNNVGKEPQGKEEKTLEQSSSETGKLSNVRILDY